MTDDPIHLYILRCVDGSHYVGTARQGLERRVSEHNGGTYAGFTASRRPVELGYSCGFQHFADAVAAARQIKGWTRAKKEALIAGDFTLLSLLASRATKG